MKTYVLYHASCWDGFCAAWIARNALQGKVECIPVQYGQDPPAQAFEKDATLYILDFSYRHDVMCQIASLRTGNVIVLDHHKTAEAELKGIEQELIANGCGDALTVIFDMDKSGARLTWEHFNPASIPCPWLVDYTEDRDLWRWSLPYSKEVNAALRSYPLDFDTWDGFNDWIPLIKEGTAILRREEQIIDSHIQRAREVEMDGHNILVVNATVLFSDIAGKLAEGRPFGACYFDRQDGKRQWSLRSRDGGVDVAEIAKAHGGGGHRNAAGFEEVLTS